MTIKFTPILLAVDITDKKVNYLRDIKKKNHEIREIKTVPTVINTDNGKETIDTLSLPGGIVYLDLKRIIDITGLTFDEIIKFAGFGSLASYDEKTYINSCNLIRLYNNANTDRAFFNSMLNLGTKTISEQKVDKLQLTHEIMESVKKLKSALDSEKDKQAKYAFYDRQQQDYLHDIENGHEDDHFLPNMRTIRYRRRKMKNDIVAIESISGLISDSNINKAINKLKKTIVVNNEKIYVKRAEKVNEIE